MSRHLTPIIASLVAHSGLLCPMLIDPLFSVIASDIDIRIEGNEFIPGALTTGECVKLKHSGRVVQILDLCYRPYTWCELSFLFVREFLPLSDVDESVISKEDRELARHQNIATARLVPLVRTNKAYWVSTTSIDRIVFPLHIDTITKYPFGVVDGQNNVYFWKYILRYRSLVQPESSEAEVFEPDRHYRDLGPGHNNQAETLSERLLHGINVMNGAATNLLPTVLQRWLINLSKPHTRKQLSNISLR